jgi:crotonobetainyl-CoA:carnitine CoA-transferase CaiB-like acyl-CoA transferase
MCNKEKFWGILCDRIDRPQWKSDPRFLKFPDRLKHRAQLTELLDEALSTRTTAEWIAHFSAAVPCAPILDVAQALENPFVKNSDRIDEVLIDNEHSFRLLANPVRTAGKKKPSRRAPTLGEDNYTILGRLGFDEQEISRLRKDGVI